MSDEKRLGTPAAETWRIAHEIAEKHLQECQQSNWANRRRADTAEARLARLTALLEDRQGMAVVVFQEMMHYSSENFLLRSVAEFKAAERIADRLIAYLKPLG